MYCFNKTAVGSSFTRPEWWSCSAKEDPCLTFPRSMLAHDQHLVGMSQAHHGSCAGCRACAGAPYAGCPLARLRLPVGCGLGLEHDPGYSRVIVRGRLRSAWLRPGNSNKMDRRRLREAVAALKPTKPTIVHWQQCILVASDGSLQYRHHQCPHTEAAFRPPMLRLTGSCAAAECAVFVYNHRNGVAPQAAVGAGKGRIRHGACARTPAQTARNALRSCANALVVQALLANVSTKYSMSTCPAVVESSPGSHSRGDIHKSL